MVERFVKEYANYKVKAFPINNPGDYEKRNKYKEHLEKIVSMRDRGLITCDEAINSILSTLVTGW